MDFKDFNIEEKYKIYKEKNLEELYENLKAKADSKNISKKEYKEYVRICNLKENSYIIENLMSYINDLKQDILQLEKEKENRQLYRELQKRELQLTTKIKLLDEYILDLNKIDSEKDLDEEEKNILENHIKSTIDQKESLKKQLEEIKKQINEKDFQQNKKVYSYEEQKDKIFKIKTKMYHAAITLDYLLKGKSWDETLKYYMEWQNSKYKLDSKDINVVKDDFKRIRNDIKFGNDIVKIAHNYDGIKKKEEEQFRE